MNEKKSSVDLLEKGTNLCLFLTKEKEETALTPRLFDAICTLSECCYSLSNPALSKTELSALRKSASLEADKVTLYLEALCIGGSISPAQKESMSKTLEALKKETNI
ncbi:MAG: hypothetical protein IKU60_00875 [Clostridia bacterium]|nr:hypothetical protein [Clostridia bacterium]